MIIGGTSRGGELWAVVVGDDGGGEGEDVGFCDFCDALSDEFDWLPF